MKGYQGAKWLSLQAPLWSTALMGQCLQGQQCLCQSRMLQEELWPCLKCQMISHHCPYQQTSQEVRQGDAPASRITCSQCWKTVRPRTTQGKWARVQWRGWSPHRGKLTSDDEGEEELIPSPEFWGLVFEAMLRSVVTSKKNLKKAWSRETELWNTTRADARHLQGIPGPNSPLAVMKINVLQAMYGEDAFKPPALPYCFGTKAKQEDAALVQIQEIAGLLGGAITSPMEALTLVRQHLQQTATELGEDLANEIVLAL